MFSPFPKLTRRSVGYLVQGISEVYGVDEDRVVAAIKDGLDTAQGSLSSGSGSVQDAKDARLGQVSKLCGQEHHANKHCVSCNCFAVLEVVDALGV